MQAGREECCHEVCYPAIRKSYSYRNPTNRSNELSGEYKKASLERSATSYVVLGLASGRISLASSQRQCGTGS
jgi:hypothetical protein